MQAGHCFIGFDFLGDSSGFSFEAENAGERKIQGDEIALQPGTRLRCGRRFRAGSWCSRMGQCFWMRVGLTAKELAITERGVYRVEVYLPQLGSMVGAEALDHLESDLCAISQIQRITQIIL